MKALLLLMVIAIAGCTRQPAAAEQCIQMLDRFFEVPVENASYLGATPLYGVRIANKKVGSALIAFPQIELGKSITGYTFLTDNTGEPLEKILVSVVSLGERDFKKVSGGLDLLNSKPWSDRAKFELLSERFYRAYDPTVDEIDRWLVVERNKVGKTLLTKRVVGSCMKFKKATCVAAHSPTGLSRLVVRFGSITEKNLTKIDGLVAHVVQALKRWEVPKCALRQRLTLVF